MKNSGTVQLSNMKTVENSKGDLVVVSRSGELIVNDTNGRERERYKLPYGALVTIGKKSEVEAGQVVANWDPHTHPIVSEVAGKIAFEAMEEGITVREQARSHAWATGRPYGRHHDSRPSAHFLCPVGCVSHES